MTPEEKKNALRSIARRANDEVKAQRRSSKLRRDITTDPQRMHAADKAAWVNAKPSLCGDRYFERIYKGALTCQRSSIRPTSWQSAGWK